MADEIIRYEFTGDSSGIVNAAQQAMDALSRVDSAQNQLASSNPFAVLGQTLNNISSQLGLIGTSMQAFSAGINGARITSESLSQTLNGLTNSIVSAIVQMNRIGESGQGFNNSANVIETSLAKTSNTMNQLGNQMQGPLNSGFMASNNAIQNFSSYMQQVSNYTASLTGSTNSTAGAFNYLSNNINTGSQSFNNIIALIARTRNNLSDTGKSAGDVTTNFNKINSTLKQTRKHSSNVKNLSKTFSNLSLTISKTKTTMVSFFKQLSGGVGSALGSLKTLAGGLSLGKILKDSIAQSNEYIETLNLFTVAAGDLYPEMKANIDILEHFGGLAPTTLMNAAGVFKILASEMGVANDKAATMANSLTNLSVDLASLFNKDFNTVITDLNSGLQGMTKSTRKYGIDITEAALAETAASLGITKKTSAMSQAEKMQLRYVTILRQTTLSQQDFARTIQTPANMLKILKEQLIECGRALGNVFQPLLQAVLPALIRLTLVIKNVVSALATLFGYKPRDMSPDTDAYEGAAAGAADVADSTADAVKQQKKLNNLMGGFDEINQLQDPKANTDSGSGGGSTGGGGGSIDIELPTYDNMLALSDFMPKLREEAAKVSEAFMSWLNPIIASFNAVKQAWAPVGDAFKESANTLFPIFASGLQNIILTGFLPFLSSLGGAFATVIPAFTQFAQDIAPSVENAFNAVSGVGRSIVTVFADIAAGVSPSLAALSSAFLDQLVVPFLNGCAQITQESGPSLTNLFNTLMGTLTQVINTVGPPLKDLFTTLGTTLIPVVCDVLSILASTILPPLANFISGLIAIITPFITNLMPILQEALNALMPIIGDLANAILPLILDLISTLFDILTPIIEAILPPLIDIIKSCSNAIKPIIKALLPPLTDLLKDVGGLLEEFISAVLPPLVDLFNAVIEPVSEIISALLPPLIDCVDRLLKAIMPLLSNVLPPLIKLVTSIIKPIMQIIKECLTPVIDIITTLLTPILEVIINVIEILISVLTPIIQVIVNIIDMALQPFIAIIGAVIDIIKKLVEGVVSVFNRIKDVIMTVIRKVIDIFQSVTDTFQKFIDFIRNKLWGTIKNIFKKIGDFIGGIFKGIVNGLISMVNKVIGGINWLIEQILSPFNLIIDGLNLIPGVDIPKLSLAIPEIPKLALGGVVTAATPAIIGEGRYDEAVIPLGNSPQMKELVSEIADAVKNNGDPSNNGPTHIHVYIGNEQLDEYIYKAQRKRNLQTNGGY